MAVGSEQQAAENRADLAEGEEEGHVGADALLLQLLASLDALPRGRDLDVDAVLVVAPGVVQINEAAPLGDRGLSVVCESGITLSADRPGHDLQQLFPNSCCKPVDCSCTEPLAVSAGQSVV